MKRQIITAIVLLAASSAQAADQWTWMAGSKEGYTAHTVSLLAGQMDPGDNMDNDTIGGIELSLNCPLLQPPSNRIRQQLSYTKYDDQGVEIESIEINPHYVVEVQPGLEIGAATKSDVNNYRVVLKVGYSL